MVLGINCPWHNGQSRHASAEPLQKQINETFPGEQIQVHAWKDTVTLTGTPAFSTAFAVVDSNSLISVNNVTYSGAATGSSAAASSARTAWAASARRSTRKSTRCATPDFIKR